MHLNRLLAMPGVRKLDSKRARSMSHTNAPGKLNQNRIMELLREAKKLAQGYRTLTGKPLGITGEAALLHRLVTCVLGTTVN